MITILPDEIDVGQVMWWEWHKNLWWPMKVIGIDDNRTILSYLDDNEDKYW